MAKSKKSSTNSKAKTGKGNKKASAFSNIVFKNEKEIADLGNQIASNEQKIFDIIKTRGDEKLTQLELDIIKDINKELDEQKKKLKDLENANKKILSFEDSLESADEYDSVLRSIGSRYGEINSVYKEGEKILDITKENINGILSLTSLMKTQNADILPLVLATQKGYKGITASIVDSIGSLEDSESVYKNIGIKIDEQEKSVKSLGAKLEEVAKIEPENTLVTDLKTQIENQTTALKKMKEAAKGVSLEMQRIDFAAKEISGTMVGGWVDKFLQITKMLGVTKFGSISEAFEALKKPAAEKALTKLNALQDKDIKIQAPDQKTAETLTKVDNTKIEAPDQKTAETLTKVEDGKIEVPTNLEMSSVTTGGPLEKAQTKGIQSLSSEMQTVAKNTKPPKNKSVVARLEAMGTKQTRKQAAAKGAEVNAPEAKANIQVAAEAFDDVGQSIGKQAGDIEKIQGQQLSELEKNVEQQKNEGAGIDKIKTDVTGKAAGVAGAAAAMATAGTSMAAAAATGIGLAIAVGMLAKEMAEYEDTLDAVKDKILYMTEYGMNIYTPKTLLKETIQEKGQSKISTDIIEGMRDTEEYRTLLFQYGIKSDIKERQNLESDYFNYSKGVYMDYFNYQQSLAKDELDFRIGLERDALQFQFQQQSANLDAELEKRKTLAGSAMKFIKDYGTVSERALNAIGSSTKAIMDGMKQFGAILGGTNKSQFKLVENAQGLAYAYGGSSDQVLNMSHMFKMLGNTTEDAGMKLVEGIKEFVGQDGNVQAVFSEIAEASADIYRLMSATPDQIVKQTKALQKAGVKLTSMLKASDTMVLNYKDSIKAEMSLGAMIGQNVNLTEARAALMAGDMVGAANAIRNSLGGIDVNELNPFAKQELARATGLTMDQIIQIQQGGEIETEENKQLKMAELTGKTIAKAALDQDIANAGARLALEQAQRKEMLEFEQRMRLLTLRLEQKQRLEQIPIESQFRIYYDKMYAKKFAEEDMYTDIVEKLATSTRKAYIGGLDALESSYNESLQNLGITQIQTGIGTSQFSLTFNPANFQGGAGGVGGAGGTSFYGQPQIESLGKTVVDLDNAINNMGIRSTDSRYMDWLMETGDIGTKFKKGKIDATTAETQYKDLFNKLFGQQLEVLKNLNKQDKENQSLFAAEIMKKIDFNKIMDNPRVDYHEIIEKYADKFNDGWFTDTVTMDGQEYDVHSENRGEERKKMYEAYNKKLKSYISSLDKQYKKDLISKEEYNKKLNQILIDLKIEKPKIEKPNIQPPGGPTGGQYSAYLGELNKGHKSMLDPANNPNTYTPFRSAFFNPNTWTPSTTYQPGGGFGLEQPGVPNKQGTHDVPPLPGGDGVKQPSQVVVNMDDTNAILSQIQSEADQRGITMYTKQIDQNGNLQRIVTRTQNTAAAVETTKPDIKRVADVGVASSQNLEQIQIEMIKELQTANELLVGVLNNTAPADKGMIINLDGSKIAQNFIGRMNNRRSFNGSNTVPTRV